MNDFHIFDEHKHTKQEAQYQEKPHDKHSCKLCSNWKSPDRCDSVAGEIKPDGWCSFYIRSHTRD